jgi:hypothetical protein
MGLERIFGPVTSAITPLRSLDGSHLIQDKVGILNRWAEHFSQILNQKSSISEEAIDSIDLRLTYPIPDDPPSDSEIAAAIRKMSNGKAPGPDGIPVEIFKFGGDVLFDRLCDLLRICWEAEEVPKDFKDANIVHLYKRKGDRSDCDNHRGISLLCTAGKIMARVILDRISPNFVDDFLPESQCGFRSGRGTIDMVFSARQLQEKCREQNMDLFVVFIDLVKAFDSVNRDGLWKVLTKLGCPSKMVNLIKAFHTDIMARVINDGSYSREFQVTNGAKQGCVLAPTLFSIFFSVVLHDAFKDVEKGIKVRYRTSGGIFNLRRFQAKSKMSSMLARELLFADDCALAAHSFDDIQYIVDKFNRSCKRFGLCISLKKTEVIFQPKPGSRYTPSPILINRKPLVYVDSFKYLGSVLSSDTSIDSEISSRISKASLAFGRLDQRLWKRHEISLTTKLSVYRAIVLSILLYGCETWTILNRNLKKLESFHMRCLRRICGIKWQDMTPNTEVLLRSKMYGIQYYIMKSQFRWTGYVIRIEDDRIPKKLFY